MIKSVTGGNGIFASVSSGAPYINMSNPSAGTVRYNGNNQNFEVYDGNIWMTISTGHVSIELDPSLRNVIDWARQQMAQEVEWKHVAAANPTMADALEELKRVQEKVKVIHALVKTE